MKNLALFLVDQGIKMIEKEITKFEKEILLQGKISQLENELKEFSDLQKKVYSERLQKSIVGLENRIKRIKKMLYKT